jgi:hypothetical protein
MTFVRIMIWFILDSDDEMVESLTIDHPPIPSNAASKRSQVWTWTFESRELMHETLAT